MSGRLYRAHVADPGLDEAVGPWAPEKLDALDRYLTFYRTATKNMSFRTLYVDAFAGPGTSLLRGGDTPLFGSEFDQIVLGSPYRALTLKTPFDHYIFIERQVERLASLRRLCGRFPGRKTEILEGENADLIPGVLSRFAADWRGVIFLDSFGLNLSWSTITSIAATRRFEVVINWSWMGVQRTLANSGDLPAAWTRRLDAFFGSADWQNLAYAKEGNLFGEDAPVKRPEAVQALLDSYIRRLGTAFGYVASTRLIKTPRNVHLYHIRGRDLTS